MATALSPAPSSGHAWRMRAAIVVDVAVGLATLPVLEVTMGALNALLWRIAPPTQQYVYVTWWSVLLMSIMSLTLAGVVVGLLIRLAARGQTPGLAVAGLRWTASDGRPAWRRLLAEPQTWCAALPAVWISLLIPVDAARFFVPVAATPFWAIAPTFDTVIGPALLLGAVACMVASRRHPGRLVSRG